MKSPKNTFAQYAMAIFVDTLLLLPYHKISEIPLDTSLKTLYCGFCSLG